MDGRKLDTDNLVRKYHFNDLFEHNLELNNAQAPDNFTKTVGPVLFINNTQLVTQFNFSDNSIISDGFSESILSIKIKP